jgi:hypothetical protein
MRIQIFSDRSDKLLAFFHEGFHLLFCQLEIFPIIASLPKFKSLVEGTPHGIGEKAILHKTFVEIGQNAAMF